MSARGVPAGGREVRFPFTDIERIRFNRSLDRRKSGQFDLAVEGIDKLSQAYRGRPLAARIGRQPAFMKASAQADKMLGRSHVV